MTADPTWLRGQLATLAAPAEDSPAVDRLRGLLQDWAIGFCEIRADVASAAVTWPRRGVLSDESSSFLRALGVRHGRCGWVRRPAHRPSEDAGWTACTAVQEWCGRVDQPGVPDPDRCVRRTGPGPRLVAS
jgi:hypothetical protein